MSGQTKTAVIGMEGRYPGAPCLEAFWNLITNPQPESPHLLRLTTPAAFDATFWGGQNIPRMTDETRHLLDVVRETLETAGYADGRLAQSNTGVWVARAIDYRSGASFNGDTAALLASLLNCRGPCLEVNTLCSSALTAVHLAMRSLDSGECETALVAAVRTDITAEYLDALAATGALSAKGRCRPFSRESDGWVPAEGAGALLLKRLDDALQDGDSIFGVLLASASRHGGRGGPVAAVSLDAQVELTRETLARAGIPGGSISYVEANAVGQALSDLVEVAALVKTLGDAAGRVPCRIGSVKANLGHMEAVAGMAGLQKTLLSLRNNKIPAMTLEGEVNPNLGIDSTRLVLAEHEAEWRPGKEARRALVNAFGLSGVYAQVIVEDAPARRHVTETSTREILALSAHTPEGLLKFQEELHREIERSPQVALADLCYSMNTGRPARPCRSAFVSTSVAELKHALSQGAQTRADAPRSNISVASLKSLYEMPPGIIDEPSTTNVAVAARTQAHWMDVVAELWSQNININWESAYIGRKVSRHPAPAVHLVEDSLTPTIERPAEPAEQPPSRLEAFLLQLLQKAEPRVSLRCRDQNFFEAGFDSLSIIAACRQFTDITGEEISYTLFFDNATAARLADYLSIHHAAAVERILARKPGE